MDGDRLTAGRAAPPYRRLCSAGRLRAAGESPPPDMGLLFGFAALFAFGLATMGSLHLLGATVAPPEKQTHLFETAAGERHNPFGGSDDRRRDAADEATACAACGAAADGDYRFCAACGAGLR